MDPYPDDYRERLKEYEDFMLFRERMRILFYFTMKMFCIWFFCVLVVIIVYD